MTKSDQTKRIAEQEGANADLSQCQSIADFLSFYQYLYTNCSYCETKINEARHEKTNNLGTE